MPLSAARTLLCGPRYALSFDGVGNYVRVAFNEVFNVDEITVIIWWKMISVSDAFFISRWLTDDISTYIFQLSYYNNRFYVEVYCEDGSKAYIEQGYPLPYNVWHFFAFTYDKHTLKGYHNGELKFTATGTGVGLRKNEAPIYLATFWGLIRYLCCELGGVYIYSRALSDKEIAWNFNHRDNPVRNGLFMWLHWDSIDISAGKWYDKTVFGNHGTIYGATLAEPIRAKARILSPVRTLAPAR